MAEPMDLKAAKEYVREHARVDRAIQRRPSTLITIFVPIPGQENLPCMEGVGFSKVMWPDRWNWKRGLAIALGKAEVDAARQLLARGDGEHG